MCKTKALPIKLLSHMAVIQRIELWSLARQASIITPILYHHIITYINQLFYMILSLFLKNRLKPHRIYGFCIPLPFAMHQYTPTFADRLLLSALPLESNQTYFHSTHGGLSRIRTLTSLGTGDFRSPTSAIPSPPHNGLRYQNRTDINGTTTRCLTFRRISTY